MIFDAIELDSKSINTTAFRIKSNQKIIKIPKNQHSHSNIIKSKPF